MRMYALFTDSGAPVAGLTLAEIHFTVKRIKRSDNSVDTPVNAQAAIVDCGGGYYLYDYAAADFTLYNYVWLCQYTGVTSVDCAYVFGSTDNIAQADAVPGVALTGEAAAASSQGEAATALASWVSAYAAPLMRILSIQDSLQGFVCGTDRWPTQSTWRFSIEKDTCLGCEVMP